MFRVSESFTVFVLNLVIPRLFSYWHEACYVSGVNSEYQITDLVETNDSAGRRFRGKVNGKCFQVFRNISNAGRTGRITRGLANEPENWHCEGYGYQQIDGRSVPVDLTTPTERKAAKAHCMKIIFQK